MMGLEISIASLVVALIAIGTGAWYFRRETKALRGTEARLKILSDEMYTVLEFAKNAFSNARLKERLQVLAQNYACLGEQGGILSKLADEQLDMCVQLSLGAIRDAVEIRPVYLEPYAVQLIRLAVTDDVLFATSYVKTSAFWHSPRARAYIRENEAAVERGVTVVRVFLFDDENALKQSEGEMNSQCEKGIHVRTALTNQVEPELRRDLFYLEDHVAAEYVLTADREDLLALRIVTSPPELRLFKDITRRLVDASQEHGVKEKTHEQG